MVITLDEELIMTLSKNISKNENGSLSFLNYQAVHRLIKLAESSFDLSLLTPERVTKYYAEACDLKLLYGTEKIDDHVMQSLEELAKEAEAVIKMHRMQEGEVVNYIENFPSEKRSALHTATRDFFKDPMTSIHAREASKQSYQEVEKLKAFMDQIDSEKKFTEMIMVGIGGSDLGPRANYYALQHLQKKDRKIYFVSNVDPDDVALVLRQAHLKKCLVIIISKSGGTLETAVNEEFIKSKFSEPIAINYWQDGDIGGFHA